MTPIVAASPCVALGARVVLALALRSRRARRGADMNKVIRDVFPAAETGFDPAAAHDLYSGTIVQAIFETLYTYDYLARPAKLVPLAAEALPQVTDDGRTYTVKLRKGIHFTPDPAFKGGKRELAADDYVYSLKRLMDPKIRSPWAWLLEGKIVGLDELAAQAKKTGSFDYDGEGAGPRGGRPLHAAHPPEAARLQPPVRARARADQRGRARGGRGVRRRGRPRDVAIRSAPARTCSRSGSARRRSSSRPTPTIAASSGTSRPAPTRRTRSSSREMKGKKMPQVGRDRDQHHGGGPVAAARLPERRARPDEHGGPARAEGPRRRDADARACRRRASSCRASSIRRSRYLYWNMQDPVVGGLAKEKIALRRAMAMAYRVAEEIRVVRNGQAVEAQYPIPPGVVGHDPDWKVERQVRPGRRQRAARQVRLQEGRRRLAHAAGRQAAGDPLRVAARTRSAASMDEMWKKSFDAIGVRMEVQKDKFPELLKLEKQCKLHDARPPRGSPTTPTATTSCSSCTARTSTRATTPARRSPSTTSSTSRRRGCRPARARQALPGDDADHRGVCAVAARHQPLPQHAGPAAGAGVTRSIRSCTRTGSTSTSRPRRSSDAAARRRARSSDAGDGKPRLASPAPRDPRGGRRRPQ